MARGQGLSRDAVVAVGLVSRLAAEDLLAAMPAVRDRATQRVIEASVEQLADALRLLAGQADYVAAAWPAGSARGQVSAPRTSERAGGPARPRR
ncbi:MAG: hypothetical protein U0Q21_03815 [Dermatophilaceae bacterium]